MLRWFILCNTWGASRHIYVIRLAGRLYQTEEWRNIIRAHQGNVIRLYDGLDARIICISIEEKVFIGMFILPKFDIRQRVCGVWKKSQNIISWPNQAKCNMIECLIKLRKTWMKLQGELLYLTLGNLAVPIRQQLCVYNVTKFTVNVVFLFTVPLLTVIGVIIILLTWAVGPWKLCRIRLIRQAIKLPYSGCTKIQQRRIEFKIETFLAHHRTDIIRPNRVTS